MLWFALLNEPYSKFFVVFGPIPFVLIVSAPPFFSQTQTPYRFYEEDLYLLSKLWNSRRHQTSIHSTQHSGFSILMYYLRFFSARLWCTECSHCIG